MPEPTPERLDQRAADQLRPVRMETGIAPHADGSVLIAFGDTQVICAACVENKVPSWMKRQGVEGGWMSAEYSMLPYATLERKTRAITRGRQDGRTIEIQRLIGRSLRAVADLSKLPGHTLWLDCDVLQADGGTRTASITGAYVAAQIAIARLLTDERIAENPLTDSVAAISAGIVNGQPLLDLAYAEDSTASVDANLVMTGSGRFVEIQSSGEEATFSDEDFAQILGLARSGIAELTRLQNETIANVSANG